MKETKKTLANELDISILFFRKNRAELKLLSDYGNYLPDLFEQHIDLYSDMLQRYDDKTDMYAVIVRWLKETRGKLQTLLDDQSWKTNQVADVYLDMLRFKIATETWIDGRISVSNVYSEQILNPIKIGDGTKIVIDIMRTGDDYHFDMYVSERGDIDDRHNRNQASIEPSLVNQHVKG